MKKVQIVVLVLLALCLQAVSAQQTTECKNKEFDVSFKLLRVTASGPPLLPHQDTRRLRLYGAWDPRGTVTQSLINDELNQFGTSWCIATGGYSRIRKISVYTDGSDADFLLINEAGRAGAYSGSFRHRLPSAFVYYFDRPSRRDQYLGEVIAHEFAHSALKIFDEYRENQRARSCSTPLANDNPVPTIMNDHRRFTRFSIASDYATLPSIPPSTAQYRCYEKSAWETLVQDPKDDKTRLRFRGDYQRQGHFQGCAIPTVPSTFRACAPPNIVWVNNENNVVMLIDTSGSMGSDGRIDMARRATINAAERLSRQENTKVAIVGFDNTANVVVGLTDLMNSGSLAQVRSRVNALQAGGGTNFQAALDGAESILRGSSEGSRGLVIMLSDGEAEEPNTMYFEDNSIPVFTVGIGQADKTVLRAISRKTGGRHSSGSVGRLDQFFSNALRASSIDRNNRLISNESASLSTNTSDTLIPFPISEFSNFATVVLRWDDTSVLDSFTLQQPDGTIIDEVYAATTENVSYMEAAVQAIYNIQSPLAGDWVMQIRGVGDFESEVAANSLITAGLNLGQELLSTTMTQEIVYPQPIPIIAHVTGVRPVVNADVTAEITMPDASTTVLVLLDDGNSPDLLEGDGEYSGALTDYSQNGIYDIEVTIGNPDGNAMFDDNAVSVGTFPGTPTTPVPVPKFQRIVQDQVEVTGVPDTFVMPSPMTPIDIIPDGSIYWGRIGLTDQVDWYRFNGVMGEQYHIQTHNLMGHEGVDMVTEVNLYEPTGMTVIDSSTRHRGTNVSSIAWLSDNDGDYLVSVAHAEGGEGIYGLTVSDAGSILSEYELEQQATTIGGGGGSGGGGTIDTLLLLLLVVAFALIVLAINRGRNGQLR